MSSLPKKPKRASVGSFCQQISKTTVYESKISTIITEITKYPDDYKRHQQLFTDNSLFEVIVYILSKPLRNQNDVSIVSLYLQTLNVFINIIKSNTSIDINVLLMKIALQLKCEKKERDTVLFNFGDKGSKFYIILKGSVAVMIPKEINICLSLVDYLKYVVRLFIVKDKELLNRTLHTNKNVYYITEQELEIFYENYVEGDNDNNDSSNDSSIINNAGGNGVNGANSEESIIIKDYKCLPGYSLIAKLDIIDLNKLISYAHKVKHELTLSSALASSSVYKQTLSFKQRFISLTYNSNDFINSNTEQAVTIFEYFEVIKLSHSNSFGEIALQSQNSKRSATIICLEDCVFGTLSREAYNASIKDIQTKNRRNNIKFLLSFSFFHELGWMFFETRFFNYFTIQTAHLGEYLLQQGKTCDYIYFIKEGEFEVTTHLNVNETKTHIRYMMNGSASVGAGVNEVHKRQNESSEMKMNKRKFYRIAIYKDKDVIGMDDMFDVNKVCLFNVRCVSEKGMMFTIERKIMELMVNKMKEIGDEFKKYTSIRKEMMVERLKMLLQVKMKTDINQIKTRNASVISVTTTTTNNNNGKYKFVKSHSFTDRLIHDKLPLHYTKEKKRNKEIINTNKLKTTLNKAKGVYYINNNTNTNYSNTKESTISIKQSKHTKTTTVSTTSSLFNYRYNKIPHSHRTVTATATTTNNNNNNLSTYQQFLNSSNKLTNDDIKNTTTITANQTHIHSHSRTRSHFHIMKSASSHSIQTTNSTINKTTRIFSPLNRNNNNNNIKVIPFNLNNTNNNNKPLINHNDMLLNKIFGHSAYNTHRTLSCDVGVTSKIMKQNYNKSIEILLKDNNNTNDSSFIHIHTPKRNNKLTFIDLLQFEPLAVKKQGRLIASAKVCGKYRRNCIFKKVSLKYMKAVHNNNNNNKSKPMCIRLNK